MPIQLRGSSTAGATYYQPSDNNLLAWSYDPADCTGLLGPTAGNVYAVKIPVPRTMTVTAVAIHLRAVGTGATALANCFTALYDKNGTRLGVSADQSSDWATALNIGYRAPALTPDAAGSLTIDATAGYVFAARLIGTQSTTNCTMSTRAQSIQTLPNIGLAPTTAAFTAGAVPRSWVKTSGLTAMPATIDLSTVIPAPEYWAGLA